MGSLPEGTLCGYCGKREAGDIPDGCIRPLCFDADRDEKDDLSVRLGGMTFQYCWAGESCYDVVQQLGWHVLENGFLARAWLAFTARLSRREIFFDHNMPVDVRLMIARCLVHA